MSDIIFKVSHYSRDSGVEEELVVEDKVNDKVIEVLNFTRNVSGFKLTVERVQ